MRNLFIEELTKQAEKNKKIILIVGDLGYGIVEPFLFIKNSAYGHTPIRWSSCN